MEKSREGPGPNSSWEKNLVGDGLPSCVVSGRVSVHISIDNRCWPMPFWRLRTVTYMCFAPLPPGPGFCLATLGGGG